MSKVSETCVVSFFILRQMISVYVRAAMSTLELFFTTHVVCYFLFPVANYQCRLHFCSKLINCWNLWKLGISFAAARLDRNSC